MTDAFSYSLYPPDGAEPKQRPMIKVTLANGSKTFPTDALIDSGSDITLSYEQIGVNLGIDFRNPATKRHVEQDLALPFEDEVSGLGKGTIPVYIYPIRINMHGIDEIINVRWIRLTMDSKYDLPVILGQDSIFFFFDIHFSRRQKKFFLNKEELKH